MSNFQHLEGMRNLLAEIYEINERILTLDICSAKTALASTNLKKILAHYHEALHEDGATKVSLQAYIALLKLILIKKFSRNNPKKKMNIGSRVSGVQRWVGSIC